MARPTALRMAPREQGDWKAGSVRVATGAPSRIMVTDPADGRFPVRLPWCTSLDCDGLFLLTGAIMREAWESENPSGSRINGHGNYPAGNTGNSARTGRSVRECEMQGLFSRGVLAREGAHKQGKS